MLPKAKGVKSERSAAWLAHQSGGLGVGSSNLPAPTNNFKRLSGYRRSVNLPRAIQGHAPSTSRRLAPEGMRRGAGRVGPFSLFDMDAAFAAPRERKGLSAAIPQIASLPGASPTFSRHDEVMLRMVGRSHAAHGRQH